MDTAKADWFLRHHDKIEHGPFPFDGIVTAAKAGNLTNETEVFHQQHTKGQWIKAIRIKQINDAMPKAERMFPSVAPDPVHEPTASVAAPQPTINVAENQGHSKRGDMIVPKTLTSAFFAIFDFKFKYYITPWIIRVQWAIFVCAMLLVTFVSIYALALRPVFESLSSSDSADATSSQTFERPRPLPSWEFQPPQPVQTGFSFVSSILGRAIALLFIVGFCVVCLLYVRLVLEGVIVFFRISEDLTGIHSLTKAQSSRQNA